MMAKRKALAEMVTADADLLSDAIARARARAHQVYAVCTHTMIDEVDGALWGNWGDDEGNVIIMDKDILEDNDPFDHDDLFSDAA